MKRFAWLRPKTLWPKVRLASGIEVSLLKWFFKRTWDRLFPRFLLPIRLPYRGWWLAGNDLIDDLIFVGAYECAEWRFFERFVREGMTVLDIGAHHGFYTVLGAKRVGETGHVIAFEPSPRERNRLSSHLWLNGIRDTVKVYPEALTSEQGEATLFMDLEERNTGHNSLQASGSCHRIKQVIVRTESLDRFLKDHGIDRVDLIKLDVEGAELDVLRGATDVLVRRPRPAVMAEVQDSTCAPWGYPASAIYDLMSGLGYSWFSITMHGSLRPSPRQERYDSVNNMVALPEEMLCSAAALIDESNM